MGPRRYADDVVHIKYPRRPILHLFDRQWVNVVDDDSIPKDVIARFCKIATVISKDYVPPESPPLARVIQNLIQISVVAESVGSDQSSNAEVVEFLQNSMKPAQFPVAQIDRASERMQSGHFLIVISINTRAVALHGVRRLEEQLFESCC